MNAKDGLGQVEIVRGNSSVTLSTGRMVASQSSQGDLRATVYQSTVADLQATVTPAAGSTWAVRPLQSSQGDLRVTAYQSTVADFQATVTPAAGSTWAVRPLQSTAADLQVSAVLGASGLMDGSTLVTPKFALIAASSAASTAVSSVASKKIRVLAYTLLGPSTRAVTVKFQSGSTDKTGTMQFSSGGGASPGFSPVGHFETSSGRPLVITLGDTGAINGHLTYIEV